MRVLAIDSGANSGLALFEDGLLLRCALVPAGCSVHEVKMAIGAVAPDRLVVETPVVYATGKADPNDLITQAYDAGRLVGKLECFWGIDDAQRIAPAAWKGQQSKETNHPRTRRALSPRENTLVDRLMLPPSKLHNVLDAVGIGLWSVGRLDRAGNVLRLADGSVPGSPPSPRAMSIFPR